MKSLYSYKCGYSDGYDAAKQDLKAHLRACRAAERCRWLYFFRQKMVGLSLILISLLVLLVDLDGTAALILVPFGLYLIFSKEKAVYEGGNDDGWM